MEYIKFKSKLDDDVEFLFERTERYISPLTFINEGSLKTLNNDEKKKFFMIVYDYLISKKLKERIFNFYGTYNLDNLKYIPDNYIYSFFIAEDFTEFFSVYELKVKKVSIDSVDKIHFNHFQMLLKILKPDVEIVCGNEIKI